MALSDEQIAQGQKYLKVWQQCTSLPMVSHHLVFAQAIEAEVRKQDDALIRQMLEAMESGLEEVIATGMVEGVLFGGDEYVEEKLAEAITAAKKRLNNAD